MKVRDCIKTLKRGEYKFNAVEVSLYNGKCYAKKKNLALKEMTMVSNNILFV